MQFTLISFVHCNVGSFGGEVRDAGVGQEFIFKGDDKLIRSLVASAKFKKFFEKNGIRTESTVSIVLHWSCGGFCFGSLFSSQRLQDRSTMHFAAGFPLLPLITSGFSLKFLSLQYLSIYFFIFFLVG